MLGALPHAQRLQFCEGTAARGQHAVLSESNDFLAPRRARRYSNQTARCRHPASACAVPKGTRVNGGPLKMPRVP